MSCPYTGEGLVAVRAITPDVAIVHVQRADREGNCHLWGNLGVTLDAVRASRTVIVTTEEIVSSDMILSDPKRTLILGIFVSAVAVVAWGAHPSPLVGHYNRDHQFFHDYHGQTRTREQFLVWLREWVLQPADHQASLRKLGEQRLNGLRPKRTVLSVPVSFGH
jgi:glutaconate CoA-transferase subunit A